ncbi:MAG: YchJ family protein, partial [Treponema sp.]|nr:YchJ family protein [Treponema sp.]
MKICPCGSGRPYAECCEPYITGAQKPPTAEALMRSRYSAYVEHAVDYIIGTGVYQEGEQATDIKQTRAWSEQSTWLGLTILSTEKGGPGDAKGTVEFKAVYERNGLRDVHHEKARFKKTDGQWLYEDGEVVPVTMVRSSPKVGRNDP